MRVNDLYNNKINNSTISLNPDTCASSYFTEGSVVEGVVTECDEKKATVLFEFQKENAASFDGRDKASKEVTFPAENVREAEVGQLRQFKVLFSSDEKVVLKDITLEKTEGSITKMSFMDIDPSMPQMIEDFEETNGTKEKEDNDSIRNLSKEDSNELCSEGINLEKFASERLSRAIERIKAMRSIKAENIKNTVENRRLQNEALEKAAVNKIAKNPAQQRIAEALAKADLPVTEENIEALERNAECFSALGSINMDSIYYLVKNEALPTVSNIYKASYAGAPTYYPIAEQDWQQLLPDVREVTAQAADILKSEAGGNCLTDVTPADGRRLIEHDIPLTKENLIYMKKLEGLRTDPELAVDAGIRALKNGKKADEGLLIDDAAEKEASEAAVVKEAYGMAEIISDNAIRLYFRRGTLSGSRDDVTATAGPDRNMAQTAVKADGQALPQGETDAVSPSLQELARAQQRLETDPLAAAQLTGGMSIKEIDTKLMLEEIRLSMTVEAGRRMLAKGISIATDGLEKVVAALRQAKQEMYGNFLENGNSQALQGVSETDEAGAVIAEVDGALRSVEEAPVTLLGETYQSRHEITLRELANRGRELRAGLLEKGSTFEKIGTPEVRYAAAADAYENGSTQIRHDLGDSIKKAFSNMDSLLAENGIEPTEANRRAVRILGYNGIEINSENIENIKYYDSKVTGLVEKMTPQVVFEMVGRGINPLDKDIDSLAGLADDIREEIGYSPEEKFSSFLVRLEENGKISEAERNGYIGIYRMLYQLEKNDGAAIGAAVRSGKQLTLGNLLTEMRSAKSSIDVGIDDETKQKESHYINSITDQINESILYSRSLIKEVLGNTEPDEWGKALQGRNPVQTTLEGLAESLERAHYETLTDSAVMDGTEGRTGDESSRIREIMGTNEEIKSFLTAFGTADSVANITACAAEFGIPLKLTGKSERGSLNTDNGKADVSSDSLSVGTEAENTVMDGISVSRAELLDALSYESGTDELLGIKTRLANSLIGQAFETSAKAIAARSLTEQADRLGLLNRLGENGHYRFTVEDDSKKANINLTLIRNTGNAGTISIQLKTEDYSVTSDISLVVMENRYVGDGKIYCDNRDVLPVLTGKLGELKTELQKLGIDAGDIKLAWGSESENRYIGRMTEAKKNEDTQSRVSTGTLYRAARSFVAAFL